MHLRVQQVQTIRGHGTGVAGVALATPRFLNLLYIFFENQLSQNLYYFGLPLDRIHSVAPGYRNCLKRVDKLQQANTVHKQVQILTSFFLYVSKFRTRIRCIQINYRDLCTTSCSSNLKNIHECMYIICTFFSWTNSENSP